MPNHNHTKDRIEEEMHEAKDRLKEGAESARSAARDARDSARTAARDARDYVSDKFSEAKHRMDDLGHEARQKFDELRDTDYDEVWEGVKDRVRKNPGPALLLVGAVGLAVGLLVAGSGVAASRRRY